MTAIKLMGPDDFLDPDIVGLVGWLNHQGFHTTDSGDGHSKLEGRGSYDDPECLTIPHVAIRAEWDDMFDKADRLQRLLEDSGVPPSTVEKFWQVEATYYPAGKGAIILLTGLLTRDVPALAKNVDGGDVWKC